MAARRNAAPKPEETPVEAEAMPVPDEAVTEAPVEPAEETPVEESAVVTTDQFEVEAKPVPEGYKVVIGPSGVESTVPDSIVDALVDSGYKVK